MVICCFFNYGLHLKQLILSPLKKVCRVGSLNSEKTKTVPFIGFLRNDPTIYYFFLVGLINSYGKYMQIPVLKRVNNELNFSQKNVI